MNEQETWEQPQDEQTNATHEAIEESAGSDESGSHENKGEFGKFKSAEALLSAYNSLQAEFTRKSQRLSEIEKEKTQATTTFSEQDVESELNAFLSENSEAKPFADELKEMALTQQAKPEFDKLFASLAVSKLASGQSKKDNPIIKKYVFQDEELKNFVIENYMKQLNEKKPPIVISSDIGERATGQTPASPKSLAEAKKMVEDMFS